MTFIDIVMFILFITSIIILFDKANDGKSFLSFIFIIGLLIHNANKADIYRENNVYYKDVIKNIIKTQDINLSKINNNRYKLTIINLQNEIRTDKFKLENKLTDTNSSK